MGNAKYIVAGVTLIGVSVYLASRAKSAAALPAPRPVPAPVPPGPPIVPPTTTTRSLAPEPAQAPKETEEQRYRRSVRTKLDSTAQSLTKSVDDVFYEISKMPTASQSQYIDWAIAEMSIKKVDPSLITIYLRMHFGPSRSSMTFEEESE